LFNFWRIYCTSLDEHIPKTRCLSPLNSIFYIDYRLIPDQVKA